MKYFTPQLYIKLQECQDESAFRAVNAERERMVQEYRVRLHEISAGQWDGPRRLLTLGILHDAEVVDVWTGNSRLTIILRVKNTSDLLSLAYSLVEPPWTDRTAIPEEHRAASTLWLYDEIDQDRETFYNVERRIQGKMTDALFPTTLEKGWKPIFLHAILLSNGCEIRLRFRQVKITRMRSLFKSAECEYQDEDSLGRSA